jgi:hypothetical protein
MKNADKPASPVLTYEDYECSDGLPAGYSVTKQRVVSHGGLTKREMFAMHAMQGLVSNNIETTKLYLSSTGEDDISVMFAKMSVEFADALLAELDK